MDIEKIRAEYPILDRQIYGKPLVYFDNAATSQTPRCVVDTIADTYNRINANVHRGVHTLSQEATHEHEEAREKVRRFIGAASTSEVIFTRGTTEALNLVASSFGGMWLKEGDEVILTVMEHHANIVPWQLLQSRINIRLRVVPIDERGVLCQDIYRSLFNERTRLVSFCHVSNVLGTVNPVKEMIAYAHGQGVPVVVDGAQAAPWLRVDVQDLDADFYAFSAHKMYGPTGIGVLYGKEKWLEQMPPYQGGGEMIGHVSFEKTTFNELPFKFEAGTPDYVGARAFGAALDYIDRIGLDTIAEHERELTRYATEQLSAIDGMRIFGQAPDKSGVISFLVGNIHHYDMGLLLDKLGIAVRTGHHCAQPLMESLGIEGTVRASFSVYNTREEVDVLAAAVRKIALMFG